MMQKENGSPHICPCQSSLLRHRSGMSYNIVPSLAFTRTTLLFRNGPIKESIPFLESFSRQFCSLRLVQSRLDCSLFCCKGRYVFGFLQVVLYQLKLSAPYHVRVIGHARLVGQFFGKKKKNETKKNSQREVRPVDGQTLYKLLDGVFSDEKRSFNQWERAFHPNFIKNVN